LTEFIIKLTAFCKTDSIYHKKLTNFSKLTAFLQISQHFFKTHSISLKKTHSIYNKKLTAFFPFFPAITIAAPIRIDISPNATRDGDLNATRHQRLTRR
jgi:hypothetical protein